MTNCRDHAGLVCPGISFALAGTIGLCEHWELLHFLFLFMVTASSHMSWHLCVDGEAVSVNGRGLG